MKNINSENPCYERLAGGGQLLKGLKNDVTQRVKPEESKTDRFFADAQNDGKRAAFTLAETMIVLVILGIVAAITVPALVRNQMEVQNRTRLRKAMTVYDMAINKMVVENNFKDTKALTDWANGNNCVNTREYFKIVQDGKNGCIFSTSGGLWWNISDITKPIVGFNENDIEAANSTTSFQLFGHFGDNGELRIDDLAYEQVADFLSEDEKQLLADLYNFANNIKEESSCPYGDESNCKALSTYRTTLCTNEKKECFDPDTGSTYDHLGRQIWQEYNCDGFDCEGLYIELYNGDSDTRSAYMDCCNEGPGGKCSYCRVIDAGGDDLCIQQGFSTCNTDPYVSGTQVCCPQGKSWNNDAYMCE